jgi:hypothetical protein
MNHDAEEAAPLLCQAEAISSVRVRSYFCTFICTYYAVKTKYVPKDGKKSQNFF